MSQRNRDRSPQAARQDEFLHPLAAGGRIDSLDGETLKARPRRDNTDRSLARSAWENRPSEEPSRRVRYDRAQLLLDVMDRFLKLRPETIQHKVSKFSYSKFVTPIIELVRTPARITPYPTGLGVALSQALRARLRSIVPPGHAGTALNGKMSKLHGPKRQAPSRPYDGRSTDMNFCTHLPRMDASTLWMEKL